MESTPGRRIQQWRESKGLTLSQVSRDSGIKVTTLSTAEQPGASNPSFDTLSKLLSAYPDLNSDWLLLGTGPMFRDGRELTRLPADPAPAKVEAATPLQVVAESDQVKELKEQVRELREHNKLLTDLLRSGVDLSKLQKAVGSFKLDGAPAVVEPRPTMMVAA